MADPLDLTISSSVPRRRPVPGEQKKQGPKAAFNRDSGGEFPKKHMMMGCLIKDKKASKIWKL